MSIANLGAVAVLISGVVLSQQSEAATVEVWPLSTEMNLAKGEYYYNANVMFKKQGILAQCGVTWHTKTNPPSGSSWCTRYDYPTQIGRNVTTTFIIPPFKGSGMPGNVANTQGGGFWQSDDDTGTLQFCTFGTWPGAKNCFIVPPPP